MDRLGAIELNASANQNAGPRSPAGANEKESTLSSLISDKPTIGEPRGMNIGFFLPDLRGGGAERAAILFARHWPEGSPQPILILRSASGHYLNEADDLPIVDLGLSSVGSIATLRTPWALARVARHHQLHVIVTFLTVPSTVAMCLFTRRVRVIWDVQNPQWQHDRGASTWNSPARTLATRLAVRRLSAVVVPSDGLISGVLRGFSHPVIHVPNPVDPSILTSRRTPIEPVSDNRPFQLVSVGRLVRQKRFDLLLHTVNLLRSRLPLRLTIYGEGDERAGLEALRNQLGLREIVTFAGFEKDLAQIYGQADAFVLCSDFEGFGNVIVEALAFGLPVVATDAPYGPRGILAGGKFGVLVPPGSPGALADGIVSVLPGGDRHHDLRQMGPGRAQEYAAPLLAARLCEALQAGSTC